MSSTPPPTPSPQPKPKLPPIPLFVLASFIIWIISCCLPALEFAISPDEHRPAETSTVYGFGTLPFGCCCAWYFIQFAPYANILLFISWAAAWERRPATAAFIALISLLLALDTLLLFWQPLATPEDNPRDMHLTHLRIGFYLWLASITLTLLGTLWNLLSNCPAPDDSTT